MSLIVIFLLLGTLQIESITISYQFSIHKNYTINDTNLVNESLIAVYENMKRLKCVSLCNNNNECLTAMLIEENSTNKCYLFDAIIASNQYVSSTNSVIMEKHTDIDIVLTGEKLSANSTYLTWNVNQLNNSVFTRYLITYTTTFWSNSSTAPGMLMEIPINYHSYDIKSFPANSINDCFGPCLWNISCFGVVYVRAKCFLKNAIYKTTSNYGNCTQNNSCQAYDLNTTYTNSYLFTTDSQVPVYGFKVSLYDSDTNMWTSFSNIVYV